MYQKDVTRMYWWKIPKPFSRLPKLFHHYEVVRIPSRRRGPSRIENLDVRETLSTA
jgi:hypothetical protein